MLFDVINGRGDTHAQFWCLLNGFCFQIQKLFLLNNNYKKLGEKDEWEWQKEGTITSRGRGKKPRAAKFLLFQFFSFLINNQIKSRKNFCQYSSGQKENLFKFKKTHFDFFFPPKTLSFRFFVKSTRIYAVVRTFKTIFIEPNFNKIRNKFLMPR